MKRTSLAALLLIAFVYGSVILVRGLQLKEFRTRMNQPVGRYSAPLSYWFIATLYAAFVIGTLWMAILSAFGKMVIT